MKTILFLSGLLLMAGCSTAESEDILTSGIVADMIVQADSANTAAVEVTLTVGNSLTFVRLTGSDRLLVTALGVTKELQTATDAAGVVTYGATFAQVGVGDFNTKFVISFEREIDEGAPSSVVYLPQPFTSVVVDEGACPSLNPIDTTIPRNSPFCVEWDPFATGDTVSWAADGICTVFESGSTGGDNGFHTINGLTESSQGGTCDVTLALTRRQFGSVDPAFEGGQIVGEQFDNLTQFSSTP